MINYHNLHQLHHHHHYRLHHFFTPSLPRQIRKPAVTAPIAARKNRVHLGGESSMYQVHPVLNLQKNIKTDYTSEDVRKPQCLTNHHQSSPLQIVEQYLQWQTQVHPYSDKEVILQ